MSDTHTNDLILRRQTNAAWRLLASPRAPLVLGCLKPIFENGVQEISLEDAREQLSSILATYANNPEYEIDSKDFRSVARKEIRDWIRKGLLVERGGLLLATDALQKAFRFVESIENLVMTSTASRLATVQQKIESLEARLNPDKNSRTRYIDERIKELQTELEKAQTGDFEVLQGDRAKEEVQEVYNLSMSLRADFRRVEDSFRDADRTLRQSIISEENNRGEVVEKLLSANKALLETAEGKVFSGFYEQISRSNDLDAMRSRLRSILSNSATLSALDRKQVNDLRWLVSRLVDESQNVMRARARSERDVKGFIKTGLAAEHHRVGQLLQQVTEAALKVDWGKISPRRAPASFLPIAISQPLLPVPERICFKEIEDVEETKLNLDQQKGSLDELEASFIEHFNDLDRPALFLQTQSLLETNGRAMTIAELAETLPQEYDLESLCYWLTLAREAEIEFTETNESVLLTNESTGIKTHFHLPKVSLEASAIANIDYESLE